MRRLEQQRADAVRRAINAAECLHRCLDGTLDVCGQRRIDQNGRRTEFDAKRIECVRVTRGKDESRAALMQLSRKRRADTAGCAKDEIDRSSHAVRMIRRTARFQRASFYGDNRSSAQPSPVRR